MQELGLMRIVEPLDRLELADDCVIHQQVCIVDTRSVALVAYLDLRLLTGPLPATRQLHG